MSFRLRSILAIALAEVVLLVLILVWGSLNVQQNVRQQVVSRQAVTISTLFADTVKTAVKQKDEKRLHSAVQALLQTPNISYVRLLDTDNQVLVSAGDPVALQRPFRRDRYIAHVKDKIFDSTANITDGKTVLERVELGLSTEPLPTFVDDAQQHMIDTALLQLGLIILFTMLLGAFLIRPLWQLEKTASSLMNDGYTLHMNISGRDEISQAGRAFNSLLRKIQSLQEIVAHLQNEQQQAEKDEITHQQQQQAVLDSLLDGVLIVGHNGIIHSLNSQSAHLLGYSKNDLQGQAIADVMPPDAAIGRAHILGQRREIKARHYDGHTVPLQMVVNSLPSQTMPLLAVVLRDLRDTKHLEADLARYHQQLTQLLTLPIISFHLDGDGCFTDLDGQGLARLQGGAKAFLGKPIDTAWSVVNTALLSQVLEEGRAEFSATGEYGAFQLHLQLDACQERGVVGVALDKCAEQQLTRQISKQRKRLNVALDTQQQSEMLIQQQNDVQQARAHLLNSLAQDLQQPSHVLSEHIAQLAQGSPDDVQHKHLHTTQMAARTLHNLYQDMQDLADVLSNRMQLDETIFDPLMLVENCVDGLVNYAHARHIDLITCMENGIAAQVQGDEQRLQQILHNLLVWLIHDSEGGAISIELQQIEMDQTDVIQLQLILCSSHTREWALNESQGVTLQLCQALVNLMQGHIQTEKSDEGSVLQLTLPLLMIEAGESLSASKPAAWPMDYRVLLVEANTVARRTTSTQLQVLGVTHIDAAGNGERALSLLQTEPPYDLMLITWPLPDVSPAQFLQRMQALVKADETILADTRLILLKRAQQSLSGHTYGFEQTLTKPVKRAAWLQILQGQIVMDEADNFEQPAASASSHVLAVDGPLDLSVIDQRLTQAGRITFAKDVQHFIQEARKQQAGILCASMEQDRETLLSEIRLLYTLAESFGAIRLLETCENLLYTSAKSEDFFQDSRALFSLLDDVIAALQSITD